jgi:5-methylcytosine-specific restriction protein A
MSSGIVNRLRGQAGVDQRRRRLRKEPLCRICLSQGRVSVSTTPDHIVPLSKGGTDQEDNIQCLCFTCHEEKTSKDLNFKMKRITGLDGWPLGGSSKSF